MKTEKLSRRGFIGNVTKGLVAFPLVGLVPRVRASVRQETIDRLEQRLPSGTVLKCIPEGDGFKYVKFSYERVKFCYLRRGDFWSFGDGRSFNDGHPIWFQASSDAYLNEQEVWTVEITRPRISRSDIQEFGNNV